MSCSSVSIYLIYLTMPDVSIGWDGVLCKCFVKLPIEFCQCCESVSDRILLDQQFPHGPAEGI
jgi:hypothetical protein